MGPLRRADVFFLLTTTWKNAHIANVICVAYAPCFFLVPILYRLLFRNRSFFSPVVTSIALAMGKMSYAVYVIHWPLLRLGAAVISSVPLRLIVVLPAIFVLAWFMEYYLQPLFTSWFDLVWLSSRKKLTQADVVPAEY